MRQEVRAILIRDNPWLENEETLPLTPWLIESSVVLIWLSKSAKPEDGGAKTLLESDPGLVIIVLSRLFCKAI